MSNRLKVAFMVYEFPLLSETFIVNQIAGLIDRGCEVDIYAECKGDRNKLHPLVEKYDLLEQTYYLPELPENLLVRLIRGVGLIPNYALRSPRQLWRSLYPFPLTDLTLSLWLLHTIIPNFDRDYDIIHCQFGTQSFRGMAFRQVNAPQAKLITTFRGYDISGFVRQKGKNVYRQLFRHGDFFLTNCDFFRERAISIGCPPEKIKVNRSGLDCDRFLNGANAPASRRDFESIDSVSLKGETPKTALHRFTYQSRSLAEDGWIQIATTGRLVEKKGIEYVIRAVARLVPTYPRLRYKIIGEGPLRQHFTDLIQELKLTENVELMGWRNETEIVETLRNTHVFVAPSITAANGDRDAPINVLKEAMAVGLPVVSTYHGGIPELVEDGKSGFLVPEQDANALAEKLAYLIEHPELWTQMGKAGREFVLQHYNLERINDDLMNIYRSLVN